MVENFLTWLNQLLTDLAIDEALFEEVVLWALVEQRIELLRPAASELAKMEASRNGLDQYWKFVESKTGRKWEMPLLQQHWDRARKDLKTYVRVPIRLEDKVKLMFTSPQKCVRCGRGPPEVKLHLDHKEPVARGGGATRANLQFLCSTHNLRKGKRLDREDFFDRYLG